MLPWWGWDAGMSSACRAPPPAEFPYGDCRDPGTYINAFPPPGCRSTPALTEGVLCDLESAIGVTSQRRGKRTGSKGRGSPAATSGLKRTTMGRLGKCNQNLLSDECLECAAFCREQSAPVHGGILVIHAGRNGEREGNGIMSDRAAGLIRHRERDGTAVASRRSVPENKVRGRRRLLRRQRSKTRWIEEESGIVGGGRAAQGPCPSH